MGKYNNNKTSNKMNESMTSSHWTLDTRAHAHTHAQTAHLPQLPTLDVVKEYIPQKDKGIQGQMPVICSQCKRRMERNDLQNDGHSETAMVFHTRKEIVTQSTLSTSSSIELKSSMSEMDRKRFIMDLKNMDADCRSDGMVRDERNKGKRTKRNSLRAKVKNLKMSMQINSNQDQDQRKEFDEYSNLKNKLRIYEDKLRSI